MAFFDASPRPEALSSRPAGLSAPLANLSARWGRWRAYRRTLAELQGLDARSLADLNFQNVDLERVAHETVYGA